MFLDRSGQGLSVQTLVLIALGILVLILAILFYQKYWGESTGTLSSCQNYGGTCKPACGTGELVQGLGDCGEQKCCVVVGGG